MFDECTSLTNLKFGKNLQQTIKLTDCPLTHESVLSVIDGLAEINGHEALRLSHETYDTLSAKNFQKAENKNWRILY